MERIERQEGVKVDASFRRVRKGEKVKSLRLDIESSSNSRERIEA